MNITFGGYTLEIGSDKRAKVDAKSDFEKASDNGYAFTWSIESYDTTAADTILAVRNDHSTMELHITAIEIRQDSAEVEVEIHSPIATYTSAGTAVVGACLNRTVNRTAEATAHANETGNTQGTVVKRVSIKAEPIVIDMTGLTLGYDQAVGVDFATGGDWCYMCITGYFKFK